MKVRLKVNLKVAPDYTEERGTVFDDTDAPFPEHIQENLDDRRIIEVLTATVETVQESDSESTDETTDEDQENETGDGTEENEGLAEGSDTEGDGVEGQDTPAESTTDTPAESTTDTPAESTTDTPAEPVKAPVALVRPKKGKKA